MSARSAAQALAPLALADCIVRAARGRSLKTGGVEFSGMLWVRDMPIASFHNEGNGGCTSFQVRDKFAFAEFESLAKTLHPELKFEQADHVVGTLWDAAYLRGAK